MNRFRLAALCTAAPLALASAVQAQSGADAPPSGQAAQQGAPAGETAQTPETVAREGATPTSAEPQEAAREGTTVYRPEFFAASRPNTALDMISRLPGFQFDGGSTARGFGGTAGNVLVDGRRPASKADSLQSVLSRIPASQVERIEVIRGGAPGIDMQGQSVIANVIRRAGNTSQQVVTAGGLFFLEGSGREQPTFRYELTRTVGPRTFEFSAGRGISLDDSTGAATRVRRDPAGAIIREETGGHEGDGAPYDAKGSIRTPLAGGELRANALIASSEFKNEDHFSRPGIRTDVVNSSDSLTGEVGANWTRPLTERLGLELVGLQRLGRSEGLSTAEQNPDRVVFESEAETGESIARAVLRLQRSETLTFESGAEAAFNFRDGRTALTLNGTPVDVPAANVRVEERRGEAFATATWRPRPRLGLEAGSRFEFSTITASGDAENERSFFYPKPRLLATWTPNETDTVRLRLEREVGQLAFGDFVATANLTDARVVAGNVNLEPDQTTVIEATVERRFWEKGSISIGYTHERITDAIDRVPIVSEDGEVFDAPGNIGEGTQDELDVDLTLPLERFGISGGELKVEFEVVKSEVTDPTTGEARRISGQRPVNMEVEFRQDVPRWKITYGGTFLHGFKEVDYRFDEITRVDLDRYFEVFVDWKPDERTSLLVEMANASPYLLGIEREVFDGPRDESPLLFTERTERNSQPRIFFRLRRTIGG